jgi:uncharacterized membrane protein (Fun14 family)
MSTFKKVVLALLVLVCIGSTAARAYNARKSPASQSGGAALTSGAPELGGNNFLGDPRSPGQPPTQPLSEEPAGGLEGSLPLLSEASFFAIIGFALGYTTRKVVKLGLILLALVFVAIQGLSYAGVATVEWGGIVERINGWILNIQENETLSSFLKHRVPTGGSLVAGYFLGFRKG